jgi:lipopolysaccharide export system protein LptA
MTKSKVASVKWRVTNVTAHWSLVTGHSSLGAILFLATMAMGAEITANKMTILNTELGKVTVFEDGVSITDGATHIGAGKVEFYDQQNMAVIHGGNVNITTPTSSVTAESAQYLIGSKRTYLYRNVVIRQGGFQLNSPSVVLDNSSNEIVATDEVHVVDAERGLEISGGSGTFNLTSQDGTVSGSPRLKVNRSGGMTVSGDELQIRQSSKEAQAIGHVVVLTGDAVLNCDTMWYFMDQDSARASGSPVLKQQENLVTGDLMRFKFAKDSLKQIDVTGEEHPPKLTQKSDEIVGRAIAIVFEKGKLAEIGIDGDSTRKPQIRQKNNAASGDQIAFHFLDGEIQYVKLIGRTSGTYFTDDEDRIEVAGTETRLYFKAGDAAQIEITDVTNGKLFRHKETKESPAGEKR